VRRREEPMPVRMEKERRICQYSVTEVNIIAQLFSPLYHVRGTRQDVPVATLIVRSPIVVHTVPAMIKYRGPIASNVGPICTPQIQHTNA
jgi:hypothetical protein